MLVKTMLALTLLAAVVLPAAAQDVVQLKNGDRLAGKVTDGLLAVRLKTAAGEVALPWSSIDRIDRAKYVRELYTERAGSLESDDAQGYYILALWCRRQGLGEEMQQALRKVLEVDPEHQAARSALGQEKVGDKWVAGDQILKAKGFVKKGSRWILKEEAAFEEMVQARNRQLSTEELKASDLIVKAADENERARKYAVAALSSMSFEELRVPLYRALGDKREGVRAAAVTELGKLGEIEAARPMIRTAVLDTSTMVRGEAVLALRGLGEPGILVPFVRALASVNPQIRMNAAEAIGGLGDIRGVEYLIRTLGQNWGPTQRNNLSVMNQVSYIRDFDVEIAQAAQIGDPIVGVLREGVILDIQVIGASRKMTVVERRFVRQALVKLTSEDLGDGAVAWSKWWKENEDRLLAEAK